MTGFDYFVIIIALFSAAGGAATGLVRTLLSFGAMIVGLIVAFLFHEEAAWVFRTVGFSPLLASVLGLVAPIGLCIAVGAFVSHRVRKALKRTGLGAVDSVAGAGLGLARAWLACSAVFLALTAFPVKLDIIEKARTGPVLAAGANLLSAFASQDLSGKFKRGLDELRRLKSEVSGKSPHRGPGK